jgi:hypothetical protein
VLVWVIAALAGVGVEAGVQGGLAVAGPEPLLEAPARAGGLLTPRLAVWLGRHAGLELDVPLILVPSDAGRLRTVGPRLTLMVDPGLPSPVRPLFRLGAGALARRWRDHGLSDLEDPYARWSLQGHAGLGLGLPLLGALQLRVQLDATLALAPGSGGWDALPGMELSVGLGTRFDLRRDADRDLILDQDDACPDQAEDADGYRDDDGCPEQDNDLDGVRDELDACDDAIEDFDGVEDDDGCPE